MKLLIFASDISFSRPDGIGQGTSLCCQSNSISRFAFDEPVATAESRFPFLPRCHSQVVVPISDIQLSEELGSGDAIEEVSYLGERVTIFLSEFVESAIVDTNT